MSRIRQVSFVARIACAVAITAPLVAGCSGASGSATPAPSTREWLALGGRGWQHADTRADPDSVPEP